MRQFLYALLFIILLSCTENKYEENQELSLDKKAKVFSGIGKTYFEKNCTDCHRKGGKDNYLEFAIKNDKYEFQFFRDFITDERKLLKEKNVRVLELKKWYGHEYVHNFKLNDNEIKTIIYYLKQ